MSIVASSFSRGPTTRALDIRTGLNMEGAPEFLQDVVDRTVDVRSPKRRDLRGLRASSGDDSFPLGGESGGRGVEDLAVPGLRLRPHLLAELQRFPSRVPERLLAVPLRGLFHLADLGLRLFELEKSFLLTHPNRAGHRGSF